MTITSLDDAAWDSPWRRRPVGEKVALSLGLLLTALCTPEVRIGSQPVGLWPGALLVALIALIALVEPARIRPRVVWEAMVGPLVFLLIGGLSVLVSIGTTPAGTTWWSWGFLSVGPRSAAQAGSLVEHGLGGTLALMVLALTTPMVDILTWLRKLRIPDALLEIASLTYRLIFVLLDTVVSATEAQRCRLGDAPAGGMRRRIENTAALMGSVGVRAWNRAERLNAGLVNRGFESALLTVPLTRRGSRQFQIVAAAAVLMVWVACWALTGRVWR